MREILFRGKSIANGEWIVGNYSAPLPSNYGATIEDAINFPNLIHTINPETVGQYTGLTDKNGKRIFEGDIIKARLESGPHAGFEWQNMAIGFREGAFCLLDRKGGLFCILGAFAPSVKFEVIGNIHDNPDLLEPEEK